LSAVVAIPLTDVTQTLGRLLLVEILFSALALGGLALIAWWVVRRGLRPLEEMARTAGEIASGHLTSRVAPADVRTEVGRLGIALNAMLGEIEAALADRTASEERLRRFLADASHELRTPLTSIRGYAEIFDLGASQRPADLEVSMRHIRDEAQRMGVLVDDLLLLARLDQERPLRVEQVDLVRLMTSSISALRATAPGHPVILDAPPTAEVNCDPDRIRQVIDNLLANAVQFSPPGAPIVVRLTISDDVVVEVADSGPGVASENVDRIFEPFHRADPSRARATGGAGLGLAIVAAITHAHGGTVGVGHNEGGGACFWIRLPPDGPPRHT
jgi:two-component system OmpR family sensor kinase